MQARLVIEHTGQAATSFNLSNDKTTIGRDHGCTLHFEDQQMSALHCSIDSEGIHHYILDQSTNGTFVNEKLIEKRQRLYNGDIIDCGNIRLKFTWVTVEAEPLRMGVTEKIAVIPKKLQPNELIGNRYRILRKIGQGGMGEVYSGIPIYQPRQKVAIKILHPKSLKNDELVERFIREAKACIDLDHPRIVKVFELGEHNFRPYFVMEYIQGTPLSKFVRKNGPMTALNTLKIGGHLAHALNYAHQRNVIHRDIKPSNILIDEENFHVKLIDLGLAKMLEQTGLTMPKHLLGTPRYMPPEQIMDPRDIDARADIYSLGATLYTLITGLPPYADLLIPKRSELVRYVYHNPPIAISDLVDAPSIAIKIIDKCMNKKRENRYSTAQDMFEDIYQAVKKLSSK